MGIDQVTIEDIAVRPGTYDAYVALTAGKDQTPIIAVFSVDEATLELEGGMSRVTKNRKLLPPKQHLNLFQCLSP